MTASSAAINAVFFDLGGTLFHHLPAELTEENLLDTLTRCAANADCAADRPLDRDTAVRRYRLHRQQAELEGRYQAFFLHRRMVAQALCRTLEDFNLMAQNAAHQFCDAQRDSVTTRLQLRSDTMNTLSQLNAMGVTTAIVSNIDDDYIVPLLARTDLTAQVAFWISSERARSCKPHAGIFQQALARIEHTPEQVLFVGDSYTNDVLGARRMGMKTALLTADLAAPWPSGADFYIKELSELVGIVSPQQH